MSKKVTKVRPSRDISLPQARILHALKPKEGSQPSKPNPILPRVKIIKEAGFSPLSGTFSRAMNGVAKRSVVAEFIGEQKGLVDLGLVKEVETVVDNKKEFGYSITKEGLNELSKFLKTCKNNKLPGARNRITCMNTRYIKGSDAKDRQRLKEKAKRKVKKVIKKKLAKQKVKVKKVPKETVVTVNVENPVAA